MPPVRHPVPTHDARTSDVATPDEIVRDFCARTPGATFAVLLSAEGLVLCASDHLHPDDAERLAALAGSLGALTRSAAEVYGGGWVNVTTIDMGRDHLCLMPVDENASLLFKADEHGDHGERGELSHVLYEAARTADDLARALNDPMHTGRWRMFLGAGGRV
ncbi:roadblock/LC7 domain-containing protein [Streptomyces sp. NPDC059009]|uniref:roadblock/LC7 domain-containing protein n=1 Tax=Streptomyces sp. NPDC059009 TaxID=3346694 RepID=UPI0036A1EF8E